MENNEGIRADDRSNDGIAPLYRDRIFDANGLGNDLDGQQSQDKELLELFAKMEEAEAHESFILKQIDAMMAGIYVCLEGLTDGIKEAGNDLALDDLSEDALEDLRKEIVDMGHKVIELRRELKAAKASCVKIRTKLAIRKKMVGTGL